MIVRSSVLSFASFVLLLFLPFSSLADGIAVENEPGFKSPYYTVKLRNGPVVFWDEFCALGEACCTSPCSFNNVSCSCNCVPPDRPEVDGGPYLEKVNRCMLELAREITGR